MMGRRRLLAAAYNKLFLYDSGNECTAVTGGWQSRFAWKNKYDNTQTFNSFYYITSQLNSDHILGTVYHNGTTGTVSGCFAEIKNQAIDLTNFSKLHVIYDIQFPAVINGVTGEGMSFHFIIGDATKTYYNDTGNVSDIIVTNQTTSAISTTNGEYIKDISAISGTQDIGFALYCFTTLNAAITGTAKIKQVWLER